MNPETKQCQNCKSDFVIEPDDFLFYDKIKVPPPTWCPECRMRRRLVWRNERVLYRRSCGLCKKEIIAMYPTQSSFRVYCQPCWLSDKWDPAEYGREYDFSAPFFKQIQTLMHEVPRPNLEVQSNVNSPYTNFTWECKNAYLAPSTLFSENVFYSKCVTRSTECFDCLEVVDSNICFECINSRRCYNAQFLFDCDECIDSSFLFDCANCQNCFMSANLRNKKYVFRNKQCTPEEYKAKLQECIPFTIKGLQELRAEFSEIRKNALHKYANMIRCTNSSGNNLENTKNAKHCFDLFDIEDVRYCLRGYNVKDSMDLTGVDDTQWDYESVNTGLFSSYTKFCVHTHTSSLDAQYSDYCRGSSHIFGCVSMRQRQYCILNKQYSKESFDELKIKIIQHMNEMPYTDSNGRIYTYGEFFPPEFSPFAYNEAISQEYFPIVEEVAEKEGFRWISSEKRDYHVTKDKETLSEQIQGVDDSILNDVIGCEHRGVCSDPCTYAFKIIPDELSFYRKHDLPLPILCPNCRHFERVRRRLPVQLWPRACQCVGVRSENDKYKNNSSHFHGNERCPNKFETPYAFDRPDVVYCEVCYQAEVI